MVVFEAHGGVIRPVDTQSKLSNFFLQGLLQPIAAADKQPCIGLKTAHLQVLLEHAQHAMERHEAQCERKEGAE